MRMSRPMAGATALLATAVLADGTLSAADLTVTVEIPRQDVTEYHKPYVAVWLEAGPSGARIPLTVWYDLAMADGEGRKWLKDLRQWWRHIGRQLDMPVDGISGATRPPGLHDLHFDDSAGPLNGLPPGQYEIVVEAAREVGGREILRLPLAWPPAGPSGVSETAGSHELGAIRIEARP